MQLKKLKDQVLYCLKNFPKTRNSDITLTYAIWHTFYNHKLFTVDKSHAIKLKDLYELPREDNIKRIRAIIQNKQKKFIPTNKEIAKKRGWEEEKWRSYLGYNPELKTLNHQTNLI